MGLWGVIKKAINSDLSTPLNKLIVKTGSFVCSADFSNITYDSNNLEVVDGRLQLKLAISGSYGTSTSGYSMGGVTGKYIASRHKAPGPAGAYVKIIAIYMLVADNVSPGGTSAKIQLRADNDGSPGAVLAEGTLVTGITYGSAVTISATPNYEGLTGGQYFWVCAAGTTTLRGGTSTAAISENGENMGNLKTSADGSGWSDASNYASNYGGNIVTYDYRPLSGEYSRDVAVNSVAKWLQLSGHSPVVGAGQTNTLAIKDKDGNTLIANVTDPHDISGISNTHTKISLVGTLSREAADTTTPSISPFTLEYINNVLMPTQWANLVPIKKAAGSILSGSGYLVQTFASGAVNIDGGSDISNGAGVYLARFNKTLYTAQAASVLLD